MFVTVFALLADPNDNGEGPWNKEASDLFRNDRKAFDLRAKESVKNYDP